MISRPLILILCTGNSCRSQMAEWLLRDAVGEVADVASAGCCPSGYVHPLAIVAMKEIGYDILGAESKDQALFQTQDVDTVITVCDNADSQCPTFQGQMTRHHWPFDDPADAVGSDEEKLVEFRRIRDEIAEKMAQYGALLQKRSA